MEITLWEVIFNLKYWIYERLNLLMCGDKTIIPFFNICHWSHVPWILSPVTGHLSPVNCQLSPVTCYLITPLSSFRCYESSKRFWDLAAEGLVRNKNRKSNYSQKYVFKNILHTDPWLSQGASWSAYHFMHFCWSSISKAQ